MIAFAAIAVFGTTAAQASLITDAVKFYDASNNVVAYGTFSYDSSVTGDVTYADLTSFSLTTQGNTYDLNFVQNTAFDYLQFDYDPTTGQFVVGTPNGFAGPCCTSILSALGTHVGFFFDPMVADGGDGEYCTYDLDNCTSTIATAARYTVASAVPEPSSLVLLGAGLLAAGFGGSLRRRKKAAPQA